MSFREDESKVDAAQRLFDDGCYEEALATYTALENAGNADAQLLVGWMWLYGRGTPRDLEKARSWYQMAVTQLPKEAHFRLGKLHLEFAQPLEALRNFEASARLGYAPSEHRLGMMYEKGIGVPADESRAIYHFERAARQGHLFARRAIFVRKLSGRYGINRVPEGIGELFSCIRDWWEILRRRAQHDERILG